MNSSSLPTSLSRLFEKSAKKISVMISSSKMRSRVMNKEYSRSQSVDLTFSEAVPRLLKYMQKRPTILELSKEHLFSHFKFFFKDFFISSWLSSVTEYGTSVE